MRIPPHTTLRITPHTASRVFFGVVLLAVTLACLLVLALLYTKHLAWETATAPTAPTTPHTPFPVGVNPHTQRITEQADVELFYHNSLATYERARLAEMSWWQRAVRELAREPWWQSLASPTSRVLVIWPGERKEQVIDSFGDILNWSTEARQRFATRVEASIPGLTEGMYHPGTYIVGPDATPESVAARVTERFRKDVTNRYTPAVAAQVSLADALTIASLLERESYKFSEMREISGVIWQRLFIDMPLQLDASLQYAKGSAPTGPWWPRVRPADKFIESPFNTYEHRGLPPAPIANPSAASILAALNPRNTDCLFYFHDEAGEFYCSETYEAHVEKLRSLYGRGK